MTPFLSVVAGFSVAWLMLALWVLKIAKKVNVLLQDSGPRVGQG